MGGTRTPILLEATTYSFKDFTKEPKDLYNPKMKVFLAFLLVVVIAVNASPDKEKRMMKKWAMMKAMESCWGEANMKKWMVSMKKSAAKCSGQDAPELDLPMFQSPYRVIQALLDNAERSEEMKMGQLFSGMKNMMHSNSHVHTPQIVVVPQQSSPMEQMMKHFMMAKMMKKMHKHMEGNMEHMEDDSESFSPFFQKGKQARVEDFMSSMRFKRQAEESGLLDLGDRLNEKLMEQKMKTEMMIGNFTCVLRDQGMLNANNELDINGINRIIDEYEYSDNWFLEHVKKDHQICYELSQNLPQDLVDECPYGPQMAKLKMFLKCMEKCKMKTCMHYDVKQKLEENFGPLSTLVAQTGLREEELFPLVMKLLHGDMFDM